MNLIESPQSPSLNQLTRRLVELSAQLDHDRADSDAAWPAEQLALCGQQGVYRWFLDPADGGLGWSEPDIVRGYLALSAACLTTTFVITQRMGACRRIADSDNLDLKRSLLPPLIRGEQFATVGVSHLTTSRRHLKTPVLRATPRAGAYVLDGYSPWVTGARFADLIVLGATLDDGREILAAVPTDSPGLTTPQPATLVGLTASQTGAVQCEQTPVDAHWLLDGPVENVMQQGVGAGTGGLQTSTLAVGLSQAALGALAQEAAQRPDLRPACDALQLEAERLEADLLETASGSSRCTPADLRQRANSIALRASQAALAAAKGAGYVVGHPAGRWCREALFFLVWSCPQPVLAANLCELAGLES